MTLFGKKRGNDSDPVTQPVAIESAGGEIWLITPFVPRETESDKVEGFGRGNPPAEPPKGRQVVLIKGIKLTYPPEA